MPNENLTRAKEAQKDEFYTQFEDIEKEINAYLEYDPDVFRDKTILLPCDDPEWSNFTKYFALNFKHFGLKKLISTCYAIEGQNDNHGKILVLEKNDLPDRIDFNNLNREYLKGDGDFRSEEVSALRDEADIIITNPPFSLFREFLAWIVRANKRFLIIGNMNAVTYREVFPLIKENKVWYGCTISSGDREFGVPDDYPLEAAGWRIDEQGRKYIRVKGVRWFTNLDHGRRHLPLPLMTKADNLKYSRHNDLIEKNAYEHYDNYNAIEVPYTEAIPSDYDGVMGVPISFLDKYCPEQFELMGITDKGNDLSWLTIPGHEKYDRPYLYGKRLYARLLIRKQQ